MMFTEGTLSGKHSNVFVVYLPALAEGRSGIEEENLLHFVSGKRTMSRRKG